MLAKQSPGWQTSHTHMLTYYMLAQWFSNFGVLSNPQEGFVKTQIPGPIPRASDLVGLRCLHF